MFRMGDRSKLDTTKLRLAVNRARRNYVIQPNDYLDIKVYTNQGERIIDPNGQLNFGAPGGTMGSSGGSRSSNSGGGVSGSNSGSEFLVQVDGTVQLPMVGRILIRDLTLLQADSLLQVRYNKFYKDPFVTTRVTNNRIIVLGATGGRVLQLANDNMNLLEVLALAGGLEGGSGGGSTGGSARYGGNASNIRIIRGDLKNPQIQEINLTTIEGMRRGNLQVEPNDIVYVEPIRRPFLEGLADASPVLSLSTLLLNTFFLFYTLTR